MSLSIVQTIEPVENKVVDTLVVPEWFCDVICKERDGGSRLKNNCPLACTVLKFLSLVLSC